MGLMRKIFGKPSEAQDQPAEAGPAAPDAASNNSHALPNLRVGRASDVGRVRSHNEDVLFTFESFLDGDAPLGPLGLFILADGMGGHQAGEVASSLAARIVASHISRDVYAPYLLNGERDPDQIPLADALRHAVEAANEAVHDRVPGSGTTLTCALVIDGRAYLAHVGDSRAYLYHNQTLKQITRDHSYVDKLVELGQLTFEAAAVHPQRNE